MNNYHTFLIRSGYVTQITAHLVAGILALVLVTSMTAGAKRSRLPEPVAVVRLETMTVSTAPIIAAHESTRR